MGLAGSSFAIMSDGTVKATGANQYGQLGIGNKTSPQMLPVPVDIKDVKKISASSAHTMFLLKDGTVKGCGHNGFGQLGTGSLTDEIYPKTVLISGVKDVVCGEYYTMFLMRDGTVKGVGRNGNAQIGNNSTVDENMIVDVPISGVKKICCGNDHTIFLMNDGTVKGVGNNQYGQLGLTGMVVAVSIKDIGLQNAKDISCGYYHTVVLFNDGSVKSVGNNEYGQLGIGDLINKNTFQAVQLQGVKKIDSGVNHTLFLLENGSVKSVGRNNYGQLGMGNTTNYSLPIGVLINGVKNLATGSYHTLFLMEDGSVKSVGWNGAGQLGTGDVVNKSNIEVSLFKDVISLQENILNAIKYLIQDGSLIKTYLNNTWTTLGTSPIVKSYLDQAMTSLAYLTNTTLGQLTANSPELLAWYEEDEGAKTLTMNGPIWEEVSTTLPTPEVMIAQGHPDLKVIPAEAWADLGGDFEVVTYTNDLDETQKLFLEAMPKSQLVKGTVDFMNVAQLALVASTGVKVIVSSDSGTTWKTRTNDAWTSIQATGEAVKASGITVVNFNLITADQWAALGEKVRVAYFLEDEAMLDKITVTKVQITDATPSFDAMQVEYEELTLEGRLKDLERLNAINLAKLNFKANAIMQTDGYKLDDMVVDTFEKDSALTTLSNIDETTEQAFTTPVSLEDGFISEVVINQVRVPKKVEIR